MRNRSRRSRKIKQEPEAVEETTWEFRTRKANRDNRAPIYRRRYFTATRQAKAMRFVKMAASNSTRFGRVDTPKWMAGLLKEIDEPGVITKDNVQDWINKNPNIFKSKKNPIVRQKPQAIRIKKEIKKEIKVEILSSSDDDSCGSSLFELVTLRRKWKRPSAAVESEPSPIINVEPSPKEEMSLIEQTRPETFVKSELPSGTMEPTAKAAEEEIIIDEIPFIDITTPPHSADFQSQPVGMEYDEMIVGIQSQDLQLEHEQYIYFLEEVAIVEVTTENLEDHGFIGFHSPHYPIRSGPGLQDPKFADVMDKFKQLIQSFETWHGYLMEKRNEEICHMFYMFKCELEHLGGI